MAFNITWLDRTDLKTPLSATYVAFASIYNTLKAWIVSPVQKISNAFVDTDIIIDGKKEYSTTKVIAGATHTITASDDDAIADTLSSEHKQGNELRVLYQFDVDCTITLTNFESTGNNTGTITPIPAGSYNFKFQANARGVNLVVPQNASGDDTTKLSKTLTPVQEVVSKVKFLDDVSIGDNTQLAPLHVGDRDDEFSVDSQVLVSRNVDDTETGNGHCFSDSSRITRSGNMAYNSFDARVQFFGANTHDHYAAFQVGFGYNSSQAMTNSYGLFVAVAGGTGTINNEYGLYVLSPENYIEGTIALGPNTKFFDYRLFINGATARKAIDTDPGNPPVGADVIWISDGTDSGDAGDIMRKNNIATVQKTQNITKTTPYRNRLAPTISATVLNIDFDGYNDYKTTAEVSASADFSITLSNITNADIATIDLLITGTVVITLPSGSLMESTETRWVGDPTLELTIDGGAGKSFELSLNKVGLKYKWAMSQDFI